MKPLTRSSSSSNIHYGATIAGIAKLKQSETIAFIVCFTKVGLTKTHIAATGKGERKSDTDEYVFKDGKRNMIKQQNQHTFIKDTYFTKLNFWKVLEDFGKTVFLSREEAEKALAERSK